jgi:anti-sigma factor RsiW
MKCRDATEFLMDYLSGELPPETARQFEVHLAACVNCRTFLAQYRDTIAAGRRVCSDPDQDAALALPEDLVRAIMAALPPR